MHCTLDPWLPPRFLRGEEVDVSGTLDDEKGGCVNGIIWIDFELVVRVESEETGHCTFGEVDRIKGRRRRRWR